MKYLRLSIWIFFLLFFTGIDSVFGDSLQVRKNSIGLRYGTHLWLKQDQSYSPMVYDGFSPKNFGLIYTRDNGGFKHVIEFSLDVFNLKSQKNFSYSTSGILRQTTASVYTVPALRYYLLKRIKQTEKNTWYVGVVSDNQVQDIDQAYALFVTSGYLGQFSLSPAIQHKFLISQRSSIVTTAFVPLVSVISRSPYALNDDQYIKATASHKSIPTAIDLIGLGKFQLPNRFQKLNIMTAYNYKLSNRSALIFSYSFELFRHTKPATVIWYQHRLDAGITYHFR